MSISENDPLVDDGSRVPAVAVPRVPEALDAGWNNVPLFAEAPQPPALNLAAYLHGLRRHWALATGIGLLFAAFIGPAMWFWWWRAEYRAVALLRIGTSEEPLAFQDQARQFNDQRFYESYKKTQGELIKSTLVLNAALRKKELERFQIDKRETDPIAWLTDELEVSFPNDSEILAVSMKGPDKEEVTAVVTAVVNAFLTEVVDKEKQERLIRLSELDRAYTDNHNQVQTKMAALMDLVDALNTTISKEAFNVQQTTTMQRYAELRGDLTRSQMGLAEAEGKLASQKALLDSTSKRDVELFELDILMRSDPLITKLAQDLASAQMAQDYNARMTNPGAAAGRPSKFDDELRMIQEQYDENVKRLKEGVRGRKLKEIEAEITQLEAEIEFRKALVAQTKASVDELSKEVEKLGKGSIDVEMARSDVENLNKVLSEISQEREQLKVENRRAASRIRDVQMPQAPESEVHKPVRITVTILAILAAMCVPMVAIAWWDMRQERVNTSQDVSKKLGLPVLGTVPKIPERVIRQLSLPSKRNQGWQMRLTESIDGIAARLLRKAEMENQRVILVSSAAAGEGKTTLATHLAMSFARNGRQTVLVDFDLRRPALDGVFGLPLTPGVSEMLRGESDPDQLAQPTETENLSVLTAGAWDRRALASLANGSASALLKDLREKYEFVVIDASPILPVADTRFVSQHVDEVVLAVFRDVSQSPKVEAACEILKAFGVANPQAVVTGSSETVRDRDLGYETSVPA